MAVGIDYRGPCPILYMITVKEKYLLNIGQVRLTAQSINQQSYCFLTSYNPLGMKVTHTITSSNV